MFKSILYKKMLDLDFPVYILKWRLKVETV